jgi:WD40 repeat protein
MDLAPGTRVGRFTIKAKLGQGGMGAVYEAHDPGVGRSFALKLTLDAEGAAAKRFEREARASAAVRDPNVAATYGTFVDGGRLVLVVELIPGGTLKQLVKKRGPLPWAEVATLGAGIARGLAAIHAAGLVHRDLKPENVLLGADDEPKISDFGLVRLEAGHAVSQALTKTGELLGTLAFMAPEQTDGSKVDARADLYSLGATLYYLLTGQPPFEGEGYVVVKRLLVETPKPPREVRPEIAPALDQLVVRLLAKKPEDRYESALEVAELLEEIAGGDGRAAGSSRARYAIVGVGGAVLASVLLVALVLRSRAQPPPRSPATPPPPATPIVPPKQPEPKPEKLGGRYTALVGKEGRIRLVAAYGHEEPTHAGRVRAVAFCKLGGSTRIISGGDDGLVKLWDPSTGREVDRLPREGRWGSIRSIAVSADGRRVAVGTRGEELIAWDLETGALPLAQGQLGGEIVAGITPDGRTVLSVGNRQTLRRWNVDTGKEILSATPIRADPGDGPWFVHTSPVEARAAVGFSHGTLGWVDLATGKLLEVQSTTSAMMHPMSEGAFTEDGRLVTVGRDGHLTVRASNLVPIHDWVVQGGASNVFGLAVLPGGKEAVTGASDGNCEVVDLDSGNRVVRFRAHRGSIESVAASPDGKLMATCGVDGSVHVFDREGNEPRAASPATTHRGPIHGIAASRDGKLVVTGGEDGAVKLMDATSGVVLPSFEGHDASVRDVGFVPNPSGDQVLSVDERGGLKLWRVSDRRIVSQGSTEHKDATLAISPDGTRAVVTDYQHAATLLDLRDAVDPLAGRTVGNDPTNWRGAFSPDSRLLALSGAFKSDNFLSVVDLETGKVAPTWRADRSWIPGVAFLDAHSVVSAGDKQVIQRWTVGGAKPEWTWPGNKGGSPTALVASTNARLVVGTFGDGLLVVLDATDGRELDRLDLLAADDVPDCCAFDPTSDETLWVGTGRGAVLKLRLR